MSRSIGMGLMVPLLAVILLLSFRSAVGSPPDKTSSPAPPVGLVNLFGGNVAAIDTHANLAYVGLGAKFMALDVQNADMPLVLGQTELRQTINALVVRDGRAYVVTSGGFYVINLAEPGALVVETFRDSSADQAEMLDIALRGDYAYVATTNGIHSFNISWPLAAYREGSSWQGHSFRRVEADGANLYTLQDDMSIWALSGSATARPVGTYTPPARPTDLFVKEGQVWISWGECPSNGNCTGGVDLVDVSIAEQPQLLARYSEATRFTAVAVIGSYAYAGEATGIRVLDLSARTPQPQVIRSLFVPGGAQRIHPADGRAYLVGHDGSMTILNTGDPALPAVQAVYAEGLPASYGYSSTPSPPAFISEAGGYLFVTKSSGLDILSLPQPHYPRLIGSFVYDRDPTHGFYFYEPVALEQLLLIPWTRQWRLGEGAGIAVVNIGDPSQPTFITDFAVESTFTTGAGKTEHLLAQDSRAYQLGSSTHEQEGRQPIAFHGLRIFDLTNPASPQQIGALTLPAQARRMTLQHGLLFVAAQEAGLLVIDVRDPTAPVLLHTYNLGGTVYDVVADQSHLYALMRERELRVFDLTEPAQLEEISRRSLPYGMSRLWLEGGLLYAENETGIGFSVFDVSEAHRPRLLTNYNQYPHRGLVPLHQTVFGLYDGQIYIQAFTPPPNSLISGQVRQINGLPFAGATIDAGPYNTVSDSQGQYSFQLPFDLDYAQDLALVPAWGDHIFAPLTRTLSLPSDAGGQDFVILPRPVTANLTPDWAGHLIYTDTQGLPTRLEFAQGSVVEATSLTLTPTHHVPAGAEAFAAHAFTLKISSGLVKPFTVTVAYSPADIRLVREPSNLGLRRWDGTGWTNAGAGCPEPGGENPPPDARTGEGTITATACGEGIFALMGPTHPIFLPMIQEPIDHYPHTYRLVAQHAQFMDLCLSVASYPFDGLDMPVQNPCDDSPEQLWQLRPQGGAHQIVSATSGECLGIRRGLGTPGERTVLSACDPAAADQRWHVVAEAGQEDIVRFVRSDVNLPLCLDVLGASYTNWNGIIQWPCNALYTQQMWRMEVSEE